MGAIVAAYAEQHDPVREAAWIAEVTAAAPAACTASRRRGARQARIRRHTRRVRAWVGARPVTRRPEFAPRRRLRADDPVDQRPARRRAPHLPGARIRGDRRGATPASASSWWPDERAGAAARSASCTSSAICTRLATSSLASSRDTWALTVATLMCSSEAISAFERPSPTASATSCSRALSSLSRLRAAAWRSRARRRRRPRARSAAA